MRVIGRAMNYIIRLIFVLMFVVIIALIGYVLVKGSQPMGFVGVDPVGQTAVISDMNYWEYMSDRLAASRETTANCHRTRLIYLVIALPVYPAVYSLCRSIPREQFSPSHPTQPTDSRSDILEGDT